MTATNPEKQLESFLAKYDPAIATQARAIRSALRALFPSAFELIYDNYNALAIGFGPSDRASEVLVSFALYPRWVTLFFLQGKRLADPHGVLKGEGKRVRHVVLKNAADLKQPALKTLLKQATAGCEAMRAKGKKGVVIVKSVSAKQRPRRPAKGGGGARPHASDS